MNLILPTPPPTQPAKEGGGAGWVGGGVGTIKFTVKTMAFYSELEIDFEKQIWVPLFKVPEESYNDNKQPLPPVIEGSPQKEHWKIPH